MLFSIIIPAIQITEELIFALGLLDPIEKTEIIVISNTAITADHKSQLEDLGLFYFEQLALPSPYSSKNMGYKHAKGEILVFIDSTIFLQNSSLSDIVNKIRSIDHFDILSCQYFYRYRKDAPNYFELYDSLTLQPNNYSNGIPGGFLIVKKTIMDQVGLFLEVRSLADIVWTRKAVCLGFSIKMINGLKLNYIPKNRKELLNKARRMGAARLELFKKHRNPLNEKSITYFALKQLLPTNPIYFFKVYKSKSRSEHIGKYFPLYIVSYLVKLYYFLGLVRK